MIAVTFALPNESSEFLRRLKQRDCPYAKSVRVLHTGVGKRAAETGVAEFLKTNSPRLLISAGFAGALTNELNVGDLLWAENFSNPTLRTFAPTTAHIGKLRSVSTIADSSEARADLARNSDAIAVDMETEFIASACTQRQIPILSLRAISDTPTAPLGIPARILFDLERQRTDFARLFAYIAMHPHSLPQLLRIARQTTTAKRALTGALDQLLRRLDVH